MSDTLSNALMSPGIDALIGAAQSLGQAAMPTRMPTPIGSVLSAGLGGTLGGLKTSQQLQQGQEATLAAQMQNQLMKSYVATAPGIIAGLSGSAAPSTTTTPSRSPSMMSPGDYAARVNLSENATGNPAALNQSGPGGTPTSSAMGNGQFLRDTWLPLFKQTFPDLASGMSDPDILALRAKTAIPGVPDLQGSMTTAYAHQNAPVLQAAGLPPTAANLALAHRFGPGGATALLQAPAGAPISSVLGADVVTANPNLKGQTAGKVVGSMAMRMGQAPVAFGGAPANGQATDMSGQFLIPPRQYIGLAQLALAKGDPAAAAKLLEMANTGANSYVMGQNGTAFAPPGSKNDPNVAGNLKFAEAYGTKSGETNAPQAPTPYTLQVPDLQGHAPTDPDYMPTTNTAYMTPAQAAVMASGGAQGGGAATPGAATLTPPSGVPVAPSGALTPPTPAGGGLAGKTDIEPTPQQKVDLKRQEPTKISAAETYLLNPKAAAAPAPVSAAPASGQVPPTPGAPSPAAPAPASTMSVPGVQGGALESPYGPRGEVDIRQKLLQNVHDTGEAARDQLQQVQLLKAKLHELGSNGPATPFLANLSRYAEQAGVPAETIKKFNLPAGAPETEAAAMANSLVMEIAKAHFPSRITNTDLQFAASTKPNPAQPLAAADFLLDNTILPEAQRDVDRYQSVVPLSVPKLPNGQDNPAYDRELRGLYGKLNEFDVAHPLSSYTPALKPGVAAASAHSLADLLAEQARRKAPKP